MSISVDEVLSQVDVEDHPDMRTMKTHLFQKYGEDVLNVECANQSPLICFWNVGNKILFEAFYENKKESVVEPEL